jgi:prolyl-tRNA editing enzyme YbaK/EbsC (Cys-tRNA(Pro) deacylase)
MTPPDSIRAFLEELAIPFREIHHAPTYTSEESAQARGESIRIGGKALLLKTDEIYRLVVLSASLRLDSAAIREHFGTRRMRFASTEELMELTGLVPGSIPPFGQPILPFELFVDKSILENQWIAFNAGSVRDSIVMTVEDYLKAARPTVFRFSKV